MEKIIKFIFLLGFILALGAFFILPNNDDFYCLLAPHKFEGIDVFLPNGAFWRPFDASWGLLMGKCVAAFPFFNHLFVLLMFAFCAYGLNKILDDCLVIGFTKQLSIGLFMLSPALVATVYSIDSINQVLCMSFGIASVLLYSKFKLFAFIMMLLALFSKESGIAWFVVTPFLCLIIDNIRKGVKSEKLRSYKQLIRPYVISLIIIGVYFILRIVLRVPGAEVSGNYAAGLGLNSLAGLGLLLGISLTAIDSVALFLEHNWVVVITTIVISIVFLWVLVKKTLCLQKYNVVRLLQCILVTLALTAPHLVMGHPGEMHAFPTLWGIALSVGLVFRTAEWNKWEKKIVLVFFICCISVFIHKGYYMYKAGLFAKQRVESVVNNTKVIPHVVCILDCDLPIPGYSVFQATGEFCWYKGLASRVYFDLVNPEKTDYFVIQPNELEKYLLRAKTSQKFDAIWVVKDNNVSVYSLK